MATLHGFDLMTFLLSDDPRRTVVGPLHVQNGHDGPSYLVVDFQNGYDYPCQTVVGLGFHFQNDHERGASRNPLLVEKVSHVSEWMRQRVTVTRDSGC
jgi:hypothetical protein